MTIFQPRNFKRVGGLIILLAACMLAVGVASASADVSWRVTSMSNSSVAPGDGDITTPELRYGLVLRNDGDSSVLGSVDPVVFSATLPAGVTFVSILGSEGYDCSSASVGDSTFSCNSGLGFGPHEGVGAFSLEVSIAPSIAPVFTSYFELSGGTASTSATTADPTRLSASPPGFGAEAFEARFGANQSGGTFTQASGHPYDFKSSIDFNTHTDPDPYYGQIAPVEPIRDAFVDLPPGLVGNPNVVGQCTLVQLSHAASIADVTPLCPTDSQVGAVTIRFLAGPLLGVAEPIVPIYNMVPPPGAAARFGFNAAAVPVVFDAKLNPDGNYGLTASFENISEGLTVVGTNIDLWGVPGDPSHDAQRSCPGERVPAEGGPTCPAGAQPRAFLRMPTSCTAAGQGLPFSGTLDSWVNPGALGSNGRPAAGDPNWKPVSASTHEAPGFPFNPDDPSTPWGEPVGTTGCAEVPAKGRLSAAPSALDTETSSGLDVHVEVPNAGLENPTGIASSDIKDVKLTLPEGLTINPSQAEGLGVCSSAQYASTELSFHPDGAHGCPSDSKVGTVSVKTPLLEEAIPGAVYVAKPYDNPFDNLLAIYIVLEEPQRGILAKLAGEIRLNKETGRIVAEFADLPQLPFSTFDFHFREGARAPLVTPPTCGTYESEAVFTPWSDSSHKVTSRSSFQIIHGIGGGPCPSGGLPPFKPGLLAGTVNNRAGSFSPFNARLFRSDDEQEFTNFSIKLPPGVIGKIAGIGYCSDAAIALAKSREGKPGGGQQELDAPSCPASSQVGHTLAGAGVGSVLTYAPGKLYYAGPYHGSAISLVSVTAAKVGPFDLGTVVVRFALRVNPETAEIFIDATGSDPIPHIISGVTTHLRDIRAYADRPEFVLNPTSCEPTSTASTLLGSGLDFTSAADDLPVTVATRFQAADCASLPFKPRLSLSLGGVTRRAGNPALRAVLTKAPGEANLARAQVTLPKSEFLDNAHIGTVCTRVQFNAGAHPGDACPAKSIYGSTRVLTPILEYPLEGPLFLRSNPERELPDLVAALHGRAFDIVAVGHVDSVKGGGIRTTFEGVPDAPLTKVVLTMAGGKKGLLENSTNLCAAKHRAIVQTDGQNGRSLDFNPLVRASCGKGKLKGKKRHG